MSESRDEQQKRMGPDGGWGLLGSKVIAARLEEGESRLLFEMEGGSGVMWTVDGDCCSESWFADLVGVEDLAGATVTGVESVEMEALGYSTEDGRGRQEHDQVYGYKLTTDKGWCDIVFRNSSNGYYGGSMWATPATPEEMRASRGWLKITKDWTSPEQLLKVGAWRAKTESSALERAAKKVGRAERKAKRKAKL